MQETTSVTENLRYTIIMSLTRHHMKMQKMWTTKFV